MNTTNRLVVLAVTVVAVWGAGLMLRGTLSTESLPDWRLKSLPMDFSTADRTWLGKDQRMDPILVQAENANETVDRMYQEGDGVVSVHVAAFQEYHDGVQHNPMRCYEHAGWVLIDAFELRLNVADSRGGSKDKKKDLLIETSAWEHKDKGRAVVAYWYQLGDDLVFDRWDIGKARAKWIGKPFKPALMKVLMETKYTTSSDLEVARARLKALGEHVYDWINDPDHDWVPQKKPQ